MSKARFSSEHYPQPCGINLDNNGKLVTIQHCHQANTYIDFGKIEDEILKVKSCIGFFETYKADAKLDVAIRAEASAAIVEDQERLKRLESRNSCSIL